MNRPGSDLPESALEPLRRAAGGEPLAGAVVLGSGLGGLLDAWSCEASFQPAALPGYPRSTVPGHAGRAAVVHWGARRGLVLQGRVHFYEGHRRPAVTFGVRLAAALGCRWILLTNAAGATDPLLAPGTVMVVEDHLRLTIGGRAAAGAVAGRRICGSPYDPRRTEQLFRELGAQGLRVVRGALFGGLGPNYETAAEVEMIRRMGGLAACMSTVIEAEEGARLGLEVAAVSLVTNLATGLAGRPLDHSEVVAVAAEVGPQLAAGVARVIAAWCG
jgi:purine-nucleoside phosphorylase